MQYRKTKTGFTLIEALVAITILTAAIVGPLAIVSQSLIDAQIAKDKLTATYLAQEGIELVRAHRDTGALEGDSDWLSNVDACRNTSGCYIAPGGTVFACSGACPFITERQSDGLLAYDTGTEPDTPFVRKITISETAPNVEAEVTSVVTWSHGKNTNTVTIIERLLNWQGN